METDAVEVQILKTKLYPPRLPSIVVRKRLLDELDQTGSVKLTAIVAGAGYGKSTLISEFIAKEKAASVWYQLEETDTDLPVFITYLVEGLREKKSDFGEKTLKNLESVESASVESRPILSTLLSEFTDMFDEEVYIVLDDFQAVNDAPSITSAIDFLLGHIPGNLHLIILSRSSLNLDLALLRAGRELVEIGERELCFTVDETVELFSDILRMQLERGSIETLSGLTEGWISGLVLFYHTLKNKKADQIDTVINRLTVPTRDVSEYLSKAVYETQSDRMKDFLLRSSVLSRMNPDFCNRLLGIEESRELLDYLVGERLFTIPLDEEGRWFRFHHFLSVFLKERLAETLTPNEIDRLNRDAAVIWEEYQEQEQALHHYLEAKDYERAADIMSALAPELMKASRVAFLYRGLNRLPEESRETRPWLVFYLAETSELLGDYETALLTYRKAALLFEAAGDIDVQARSLFNAARILSHLAKHEECSELIEEVREIMPPNWPYWYEIAAFVSTQSSARGLGDLAEELLNEAMEHADEVEDDTARARLLFWCGLANFQRGDHAKALKILTRARELSEQVGFITTLPLLYGLLSHVLSDIGRANDGLEIAEEGLALAEETGLTPMVFLNHAAKAIALTLLNRRDEALETIAVACSQVESYEAGVEVLMTEFFAGEVYLYCGERSMAMKHVEKAKRIARKNRYFEIEQLAKYFLIVIRYEDVGIDVARQELQAIIKSLEGAGASLTLVQSYIYLAALDALVGEHEEAGKAIEALLGLSREDMLIRSRLNIVDIFLPAVTGLFAKGKYMDTISGIYRASGDASIPFLRELQESSDPAVRESADALMKDISSGAAEPLNVHLFGPFELCKGDEKIPSEEWKSKRALTIFKYLAANRRRGLIPRDIIMELLWSGSSPESASRNLNTALTSLRKTLEPHSGRGESSYLVVSGDSLRLDLGVGGWVDIELFREKLEEADRAKKSGDQDRSLELLLDAEELYAGDFLEEDMYEDWCSTERQSLKEEYIDLLREISSEYSQRDLSDRALKYLDKAIELEPSDEELYRSQMELYGRMGNRVGIERAFTKCREYLKNNFDVSPSPETIELYQTLRGE